ncbi:hypothetical protein V1515DRAFT_610833 [Lipomyces mesembrius]
MLFRSAKLSIQGTKFLESLVTGLIPQYGSAGIYSEFLSSLHLPYLWWQESSSSISSLFIDQSIRCHQYVTLKVYERDSTQGLRELQVYRYLNALTTSHTGSLLVRTSLDDFEVLTSSGRYICLVHPPLGMSLANFRRMMPDKKLSEKLLKSTLKHLLLALDFLHSEADIIHTGIVLRLPLHP